ncbi:MAG: sugar ABC transporter substrate-binding protein, partial [Butyricicoccus sp.]
MKKKLFAILTAGAMLASLAGCGGSSTSSGASSGAAASAAPSSGAAASEPVSAGTDYSDCKVSIILKTLSSEYWGYVAAGIHQAESDLGCTVELSGPPSETSYDEQMNMIETTLSRTDIQAIAVAPLQPDMAASMLKDASIPVLAVDTRIEGIDNVLTFVGTDHETAAYNGAKDLCTEFGEGAKVALIQGVQGDTTNTARFAGFTKGAEEAGAEIIDIQYCNAMEDQAVTCMEGILQTHPDVDIVFVCNDGCAQGAARALQTAGRDDILVCGYDGISSGVQSIIDGTMAASVAQDPYNIGYQCVVSLCKAVKGETLDPVVDTGSRLITTDNAADYLAQL